MLNAPLIGCTPVSGALTFTGVQPVTRDDGFPVMDISTSIVHDPKFRQLHRERPEHVPPAFLAYVAMLGESWKAGHRVSVGDAWPTLLPFDAEVVASMIQVKLIDDRGLPPRRAWDGWFSPARIRRDESRERWRRANAKRRGDTGSDSDDSDDTARLPRGTRDVPQPPSVPTVRSSQPSAPSPRARRARKRDDGLTTVTTIEESIKWLDQEWAAGRMTGDDYHAQREALTA
jgi:hypothetical protein